MRPEHWIYTIPCDAPTFIVVPAVLLFVALAAVLHSRAEGHEGRPDGGAALRIVWMYK
jgi:hypothetical protein